MIIHGLISNMDANVLEKTLKLIINEFPEHKIYTTEIGIYNGETSRGINQYIGAWGRSNHHTAIDNNKDKEVLLPFPECNLIIGSSNEVYNQLEDNSQHLIFVDGNHSFPMVVSDYFCFAPKVKKGGYLSFHDTGRYIKEFKDYQGLGSVRDADMYISVRKALNSIGLLKDKFSPSAYVHETLSRFNWELVFDEANINDEAGGICVFKKLY